jgi:hypothetical protein
METIDRALNNAVNLHPDPTKDQFQSTVDGLHRLLDELERPENRPLMRFVFAWQKLEQEIDKLQHKIQERMAERPISKVNTFLQQLKKKN